MVHDKRILLLLVSLYYVLFLVDFTGLGWFWFITFISFVFNFLKESDEE